MANPAPAQAAPLEQPQTVTAVPGRRLILVGWTAPASPSVPVARYRATTGTGESCEVTSPTLTCTISGLTANTEYTVSVQACPSLVNYTDCSTPKAATPVTPGPPATPAAPTAVFEGDPNTVRVSWAAPAPGAGIASYRITPTPSAGLTGSCLSLVPAITTSCTFGNLVDDTSYTFKVTANGVVNAAGSSGASTISPASFLKVAGAPHQPAKPTVTRVTDASVLVQWDRPTGGQTISGYTVRGTSPSGGAAPEDCLAAAEDTSCLVSGLDATQTYSFTVQANGETPDGGDSGPSTASDVIAPGLPGVPDVPIVELGDSAGEVTVRWDPPADGGDVTGYTVTAAAPEGGAVPAPCAAGPAETSCDFANLTDGKPYTFTVTATGAGGTRTSAATAPVISQLPAEPTAPVAVLGNEPGKVSLTWDPATTGGPVVYYAVTAIPAGGGEMGEQSADCGADLTTPTCTITGLDITKAYTFTVTAIGDLGSRTSPESNSLVPDQPGAPTAVTLTLSDPTTVTIDWEAPTGGGTVTGYEATATPSDGTDAVTCTTVAATTTCDLTGLDVTKGYSYEVAAINTAGRSPIAATATVPAIPSAPTTVTAVVGGAAGTATVAWADPASGTATRYVVTATPVGGGTARSCAVDGQTATCDVTGLDETTPYTFTVRAQNLLGGTSADPTDAVIADEPAPPTDEAVAVGSDAGTATVTWAAPTVGGTVAEYTVTPASTDLGADIPLACTRTAAQTRTCTFSGLTPTAPYTFTVRAVNAANYAEADETDPVVPAAASAPTGVVATLGDTPGTVTVTWDAPTDVPVTRYTVTPGSTDVNAVIPATCEVIPPAARSCPFTGLTQSAPYTFTVRAENAVGGTDAAPTTAIVPDRPGVPTSVDVVLGASPGTATVTWDVPAGDVEVTGYTVTAVSSTAGATIPEPCETSADDLKSCPFTGLTPTASYQFEVRASNAAGDSDPVTTAAIVPGEPTAPTGVTVTLGTDPGTATVTWDAPTGATVTSYTVTPASSDGGAVLPAACNRTAAQARSCDFTGLTTTAPYTFTVRATNPVDDAETATADAVVPAAPGEVTALAAVLGDAPGKAVVTWDAPADGGTVATYTVTAASADNAATIPAACTVTPPATRSCTFDTLTRTAAYTFTVRATNPVDETAVTSDTPLVPDTPGVPVAADVVLGDVPGQATVTWDAPAGGGVLTGYTVTALSADETATIPAACTRTAMQTRSCAFTGLTETATYRFQVRAGNEAGDSDPAETLEIVPNSPSAPTGVTVTLSATPGTATVTWAEPTGAAVTSYTVTAASPDGGTVPSPCTVTLPAARSCVFTGLTTVAAYTFTVRATNAAGHADSETTAPVVPNRPNAAGAPTTQVVAANAVRVTWTAPTTGGEITRYTVTAYATDAPNDAVASTACADVTGLTCVFDGLNEAASYTFVVTAFGPGGEATSARSAPVTTAGPGAPGTPTVEQAGPNAVRITWTAPAEGGPVTGYSVESDPALSAPARCTDVLTTSCVFDRLNSGTAYTFRVVAAGTADRSAGSDSSESIVPGPPGTPGRPTVRSTESPTAVLVTWSAPTPGAGIAGYTVESTPGGAGCTEQAGPDTTSCVVSDLDPATSYTFRVRALGVPNTGDSAFGPASEPIVPGAPGKPSDIDVAAGNRTIAVSWTAPENVARVAYYRAAVGEDGPGCRTEDNTQTECLITGLQNLTSYTVTVTAVGIDGSASGATSARVRPTAGAPGSPTGVQAVGGNGVAVVSWTAPASAGDGIARYQVTATRESESHTCVTANGTTLRCTVEGLTNGLEYRFTVVAIGRAASGYSAPSAAATATPRTPPGVPTAVSVTPGVRSLAVRWTANGAGAGLSGFTATATGGTTPLTCTATGATATTCTITNVPPGTYAVTVVANGTQAGIVSAPSEAVQATALLALAPTVPSTAPTGTSVLGPLTLSAPSVRQGGTVTVEGAGFAPHTGVGLGLSGGIRLGTATTDASGAFTATVTVPVATTVSARTVIAAALPPTGTTVRYRTSALSVTSATAPQIAAAQRSAREVLVLDTQTR